jgi:DNA-binding transcriptional MerR regulator
MKHANERPGLAIRLYEPDPALVYSIDMVQRLTQMPRRKILIYCRHHLVFPVADPESGGYCFGSEAIRALRWIGYLHGTQGVNLAGIKLILDLADELQRLRATSAVIPTPTQSSRPRKRK